MKIMLSRLDFSEEAISMKHLGVNHQPLNLLYLAATLEKTKHNIVFVDELAGDVFEKGFDREKPDIVGISATSPILDRAEDAFLYAKNRGAHTIFGGTHATMFPEQSIEIKGVDAVIAGEAELTFVDYIEGKEPKTIPGLYLNKDGAVIKGPKAVKITDLDSLPFPARHLIDWNKYRFDNELGFVLSDSENRARILGSRGCPQKCTFCSRHVVHGRTVRYRSIENIFSEMELLQKDMNIYNYIMIDDYFTFDQDRVKSFCEGIFQRGWEKKIQWIANARVDLRHDTIKLMKRANCKLISFGVESGSQRVLNGINKEIDIGDVINAFDAAHKERINTRAYFIIDLPGEKEEDYKKSLDLALKINPLIISLNIFMAIPGSKDYENQYGCGYINVGRHHFYHTYDKKVTKKQRNFLLRFYLRPKYLINVLNNISVKTFFYYLKLFGIFLKVRSQNRLSANKAV